MSDKIPKLCHYCGINKDDFERQSESARGLYVEYKPLDESVELKIWFCSRMHADFWLKKYEGKIEVLDGKTV